MITYYGHSDVGRQRSQNEDSVLTNGTLFVVCDGMGGRKAGEVASRLAIEAIEEFHRRHWNGDGAATADGSAAVDGVADPHRLKEAIRVANGVIRKIALESDARKGMGTTVAVVLVDDDASRAAYASVGDSRIYLIRDGAITQLSRDDSWVNAAFGPEQADRETVASMQNVLTKALGTSDTLDFDVKHHEFADGDVLLICSDGLTSMVSDPEILAIVARFEPDLEAAGNELIAAANVAGGRDNISAVLVRYTC
jgi:PPM family protein phosphatase